MKYTIGIFLIVLSVLFAACDLETTGLNATNETNMTNQTDMINESIEMQNKSMTDSEEVVDNKEDLGTGTELTSNSAFDATFTEGDLIELKRELARDPDGDSLRYTFSTPLNTEGEWQTTVGDAGIYDITISASDGKLISTKTLSVQVLPLNNKPVISNFVDITIKEGETLQLNPSVTDADGDDVTITYSGFVRSSSYTTSFEDAGTHKVTLVANDGTDVTTKDITVTVVNVNRKPIVSDFSSIEQSIIEGQTIIMTIGAEDPDGDEVTITFDEPLDEDGRWVTKVGDAGTYELVARISDGENTVTKSATVTVAPANAAPSITNFNDVSVLEGETISLIPVVTDADGDEVTYTYSGYMTTNTKETDFDDAGTYSVTLTATDGKVTTTKTIKVEVVDKNRAPVFNKDLFG